MALAFTAPCDTCPNQHATWEQDHADIVTAKTFHVLCERCDPAYGWAKMLRRGVDPLTVLTLIQAAA